MNKYKTHTCNAISLEDVGKKVRIAGFVETIRDLGGLVFLDIRDMYGITQVVTSGNPEDVDFDFVHKLAAECPAKVIAEGHIHYPEQAVKALEAGAFALVVGGAITRPAEITARFTGAINAAKK